MGILRLRSHGTGRVFDRPKISTGILFTQHRAKVSFCSDGTDKRMKFVTFFSVLPSPHA